MSQLNLTIEKDREYEVKLGESFLGEAPDRVAYHSLYCAILGIFVFPVLHFRGQEVSSVFVLRRSRSHGIFLRA